MKTGKASIGTVAIIGMAHQGLAISNLFYEAGYDVYSFFSKSESVRTEFFHSRAVKQHGPFIFKNTYELTSQLARLHDYCIAPLIVIITSSDWISILPDEAPDLWEKYVVIARPLSAVRLLSDKYYVYNTLKSFGLPIKGFCRLSDFLETSGLSFPVVVKRNIEKAEIYKYKFNQFNSLDELLLFKQTVPDNIREYLIVQESISDDAEDLDFRGYINNGEIVSYALVKEIRAFPPGVPSYLEEIRDSFVIESVLNAINPLLSSVSYTGFIGIDVKYVREKGVPYILDVNPRPPASISSWVYKLTKQQRISFARCIEAPSIILSSCYVRWTNLMRDVQARRHLGVRSGLLKTLTAKKDLMYPGDPLPFWLGIFNVIRRNI